ncbi:hypothetical protein GOODEAATRI_016153, partial [Goodea atripinnis]
ILCDLLSPADENVKVGLRETTQNTLAHLRSKHLVTDAQAQPQNPDQRQQQQHQCSFCSAVRGIAVTSYLLSCVTIQKRCESPERPSLSRAQSLRMHSYNTSEEGLKRVSSAPQLGNQDKGSLLKRKLSVKYVVTTVLDVLIKHLFSQEYEERTKTHVEENQELSDFARMKCRIRVCRFADYGCMLIVRSVHFLPDGRSVVDTIGGKRFRVLSRGMKDGYNTADIEHLRDTRVENREELEKLQELHDAVYGQAQVWFQNLKIRFHNQILQHFGPMPEREPDIQATPNGPACCWWLLAVLPIDPRYQLSVLSMTSLKDRLVKIQHILTYLQSIPNN